MYLTGVSRISGLHVTLHILHFSCTYNMGFMFLLFQMYFLYVLASLTTNSAVVPSNNICTHCSMYVCRKAPGMSVTTKYLFSLMFIAYDIIIVSSDSGWTDSSLFVMLCQHIPLPLQISLMNMRKQSAFFLAFHKSSSFFIGNRAYLVCMM